MSSNYQAKLPKRINGEIKIGKIHLNTIKFVVLVMVFGIYLGQINAAVITSLIGAYIIENLYKKYGRGVLKHKLWKAGFWVVNGKHHTPQPCLKKLIK